MFKFIILLASFFRREVGRGCGVGFYKKWLLVSKFRKNVRKIHTSSSWEEHLTMAREILMLPPSVKGDILECGCFKGGSTANLSLVCSLVNRKLIVCDSFEGLPEPDSKEDKHYLMYFSRHVKYEKNQYKGAIEEVKENIARYGAVDVCEFIAGYFENTLPNLRNNFIFVFLDVDLISSLETCLVNIWPNLLLGYKLFSHEAQDLNFVSVFFDKKWWQDNLRISPPGFVGSGIGLPVAVDSEISSLGYIIKLKETPKKYERFSVSRNIEEIEL